MVTFYIKIANVVKAGSATQECHLRDGFSGFSVSRLCSSFLTLSCSLSDCDVSLDIPGALPQAVAAPGRWPENRANKFI